MPICATKFPCALDWPTFQLFLQNIRSCDNLKFLSFSASGGGFHKLIYALCQALTLWAILLRL